MNFIQPGLDIEITNVSLSTKTATLTNRTLPINIDGVSYNTNGTIQLAAFVIFYKSHIDTFEREKYIGIDSEYITMTFSNQANYIGHALYFPVWENIDGAIIKPGKIVVDNEEFYINNTNGNILMNTPEVSPLMTLYDPFNYYSQPEFYNGAVGFIDIILDLMPISYYGLDNAFLTITSINSSSNFKISIQAGGTNALGRTLNVIKLNNQTIYTQSTNIPYGTTANIDVALASIGPHVITYSYTALNTIGVSTDYTITKTLLLETPVIAGAVVSFDNTNSYVFTANSIGDNLTNTWVIDGVTKVGNQVTHLFSTEGTKTVTLTSSNQNSSNTISFYVFVENFPTIPSCSSIYVNEYYTNSCHSFTSIEDSSTLQRILILYDYLNNEIKRQIIPIGENNIVYTVDTDGVYIAEIRDYTNDVIGDLIKTFPIYTFCVADKCMYELVTHLMCTDSNCEPDCDIQTQREIDNMRHSLTRINAALGLIKKYVFVEREKYLGMTSIDDNRKNYINEVAILAELLNTFVNRCNNCLTSEMIVTKSCNY
jgi:hypothetical protein